MKMQVGLAQISPIWLDKIGTIEKIINSISEAGKLDCDLIVFGEAILPGYPFWIQYTNGASFDSEMQKEIHAFYAQQAIAIPDDLQHIQRACKQNSIAAIVGTVERAIDRGAHSLYCTAVFIDGEGEIKSTHRKLVPTYEERLTWSPGDGHGLVINKIKSFSVGTLNCWENWMPLSRTALYAQGEDFHVALWPGSHRNTLDITRYIAQESRSYVASVSGILRKEHISTDIPHYEEIILNSPSVMANGGSCLASPRGEWVIEPVVNIEKLIVAEIDHQIVFQERQNFDPSGHYARPDITRLVVNRERQQLVDFEEPTD